MSAETAHDLIDLTYGPVVGLLSKALRAQFVAAPGKKLIGADWSNIEGRLNAWFAGEDWKLQAFRDYDEGVGPDLYKLMASTCLGLRVEDVKKIQRQIFGKTPELACVAEGELVLTDKGLVPIERVEKNQKVWDGVDFVEHSGVVYRGTKEVLRYDGLTATEDHLVWIEGSPGPVPFGLAASSGQRLLRSEHCGEAVRVGEGHKSRAPLGALVERLLRSYAVRRVWSRGLEVLVQPIAWVEPGLSVLFTTKESSAVVGSSGHTAEAALSEPRGPGLQTLWSQRRRVSFLFGDRGRFVDREQFRSPQEPSNRSKGQRRALRGWKSSLFNGSSESKKQTKHQTERRRSRLVGVWESLLARSDTKIPPPRLESRSNYYVGAPSCDRQKEELASDRKKTRRTRVYDVLNAGPRNRFTVSGRLVHNCGYQGSVGAWLRFDPQPQTVVQVTKDRFYGSEAWAKASEQYDRAVTHMGLSADQWIAIKVVINGWREANSRIVQSWWVYADAAIEAVDAPGSVISVMDGKVQYLVDAGFLWCRLPSGKLLAYARPRLVEKREDYLVDADGEMFPSEEFTADELAARIAAGGVIKQGRVRTQVQFDGKNQKTGAWGAQRLYGGLQTNNIVQGTARELLRFALHNVEDAGYPTVLHVHDEIVAELDEDRGSVAEYQAVMSRLPLWLQGLPLACKAWTDFKYVK